MHIHGIIVWYSGLSVNIETWGVWCSYIYIVHFDCLSMINLAKCICQQTTYQIFVFLSLCWDGSGFLRGQKHCLSEALVFKFSEGSMEWDAFFFSDCTEDNYGGWQNFLSWIIEASTGLLLPFQSQGGKEGACWGLESFLREIVQGVLFYTLVNLQCWGI